MSEILRFAQNDTGMDVLTLQASGFTFQDFPRLFILNNANITQNTAFVKC